MEIYPPRVFGRNAHSVPRVRIQKFELILNPAISYYACFLCVIKGFKAADIWRGTEGVSGPRNSAVREK